MINGPLSSGLPLLTDGRVSDGKRGRYAPYNGKRRRGKANQSESTSPTDRQGNALPSPATPTSSQAGPTPTHGYPDPSPVSSIPPQPPHYASYPLQTNYYAPGYVIPSCLATHAHVAPACLQTRHRRTKVRHRHNHTAILVTTVRLKPTPSNRVSSHTLKVSRDTFPIIPHRIRMVGIPERGTAMAITRQELHHRTPNLLKNHPRHLPQNPVPTPPLHSICPLNSL